MTTEMVLWDGVQLRKLDREDDWLVGWRGDWRIAVRPGSKGWRAHMSRGATTELPQGVSVTGAGADAGAALDDAAAKARGKVAA